MEEKKIHFVHVHVNKNKRKIERLCRLALLNRNFSISHIQVKNEDEFDYYMNQFSIYDSHTISLLIDYDGERTIDEWKNRFIKPETEMAEGESEKTFDEAMAWLAELEPVNC